MQTLRIIFYNKHINLWDFLLYNLANLYHMAEFLVAYFELNQTSSNLSVLLLYFWLCIVSHYQALREIESLAKDKVHIMQVKFKSITIFVYKTIIFINIIDKPFADIKKIVRFKLVLLTPRSRRSGLTKLVLILWFLI